MTMNEAMNSIVPKRSAKARILVLTIAFSSRNETQILLENFQKLAATAPMDDICFVIWDNKSWGLSSIDEVNYHSSPNGNIGFGAAVNRVHEIYDYDRIVLLNSDIEIDHELFNSIVLRNCELSETIIWAPTLLNADGSLQTTPDSLFMRTPVQEVFDIFGFPAKRQRRAQPLYYVRGAVFSISRVLLQRAGGFDEAFFLYGEEADLCFRLDGCSELVVDPGVRVIHHGSQGNKGKSREALRHSYNARVLLHHKYSGSLGGRVVQVAVISAIVARGFKSTATLLAQKLSAAVSR